jgi:glycosyltransferase involved in cell wall biosynthesis
LVEQKQKVLVVLLTYKRLELLEKTLNSFLEQTYKDFHLHISHGDYDTKEYFFEIISRYKESLNLSYSVYDNSTYSFRRFLIAKDFVKANLADIVLFLDDDIKILNNHIEECLHQYRANTYKSGWAFRFLSKPPKYFERKRILDKNTEAHYCGPGISMIDGTFFLNDSFFTEAKPKDSYIMDDLWISFFAKKVGWNLKFLDVKFELSGDDNVALYKNLEQNKKDYAHDLFKLGWNIE